MTTETLAKFDAEAEKIVSKYDQRKAAMLMLLHLAQEKMGLIGAEAEAWVSKWTGVPVVHVREVVSFYTMLRTRPAGRHHIRFCTGTSCMLAGGEEKLAYIKKKLTLENGQTTSDGRFSLEEAECLCACEAAPMMQVGDDYHLDLDDKKMDQILDRLK